MLFNRSDADPKKLSIILNWKQISKKPCTPVKGFPDTKDLASSPAISETTPGYLKSLGEKLLSGCVYNLGIGLAAPQIGVYKNVILVGEIDETNPGLVPSTFKLLVNPSWIPLKHFVDPVANLPDEGTILPIENVMSSSWEGCLSVSESRYFIERFEHIVASWFEFNGSEWVFVRTPLSGMKARIFQHETDHLFGRSIVDRWEAQNGKNKK